jgi:hypothetical protein
MLRIPHCLDNRPNLQVRRVYYSEYCSQKMGAADGSGTKFLSTRLNDITFQNTASQSLPWERHISRGKAKLSTSLTTWARRRVGEWLYRTPGTHWIRGSNPEPIWKTLRRGHFYPTGTRTPATRSSIPEPAGTPNALSPPPPVISRIMFVSMTPSGRLR